MSEGGNDRRPDPSGPTDAAVRAATGRGWPEWLAVLDEAGARSLDHKAIVAIVRDRFGLDHAWWQQSVTVGYEKARGLRAPVGETADAGFQVGVRRTVPVDADAVWAWLTRGPGLAAWLGPLDEIVPETGAALRARDGGEGEVRSARAGRRLRLRWRGAGRQGETVIQLTLTAKGERCTVAFHEEKLADAAAREERKRLYQEVLDGLSEAGG